MNQHASVPPPISLPRLAVIGCGAAAKEFVLPVLRKYPDAGDSVVLVDRSLAQAESTAREFGIRHSCSDHRALPLDVQGALITTPHRFHAEQAAYFLNQGRHVFVEKPLGMSALEVSSILQAAARGKAIAMVNNFRRLFPSYQRVRELLQSGELGAAHQVTVFDGTQFAWQSASAFYLRDPQTRGVFLDRGSHTIDILAWWLGQPLNVVAAREDAFQGVEGLMDVELSAGETQIRAKFSRFYRLANRYTIECERGTITGKLFDFGRFQLSRGQRTEWVEAGKSQPSYRYAWQLVDNFIRSIQGSESPLFLAEHVAPSIAVIDEAYQRATRFPRPWYTADPNIGALKQDYANPPAEGSQLERN